MTFVEEVGETIMKIVICDDDKDYCLEAESIVGQYLKEHHFVADVSFCTTGEELLKESNVDIIFIDVELDDGKGIEVVKEINKQSPRTLIVYLSDQVIYATDVYATKHTFFVLKKEFKDKIDEVFHSLATDFGNVPSKVVFTTRGEKFLSLYLDEIIYIERKNRISYIHTIKKVYEVQERISEIMERLPELYFLRCHNSYIVYIPAIKELTKKEIILDSGQIIPISRNYRRETKEAFALWASAQKA